MRLLDEKRRKIQVGDDIIFTNLSSKETLSVKVIGLHIYKSFEEIYKRFNKEELGYYKDEVAIPQDMEQFYSKEEQKSYGVLGIELSL